MNQAKIQSSAGIASPAETTLKLVFSIRKCLKFSTRFENGESFVSVEDPVRSKHYRIGLAEYRFIAKINGERSNANIFELLKNETGAQQGQQQASNELPQDQIVQIANWLLAMNLVTVNQSDNSLRLNAMAQQIERAKMKSWLNPISIRFSLFNPNRFLKSIQPATEWLFSSWFFVLWVMIGVYSLVCLVDNWQRVYASSANVLSSGSWIWLLITWFVLKVVHESAHGIACRKYGGEVPEFGVVFILFLSLIHI